MYGYIGGFSQLFLSVPGSGENLGITASFSNAEEASAWLESKPEASLLVDMPLQENERTTIIKSLGAFRNRVIAIEPILPGCGDFFENLQHAIFLIHFHERIETD